MSEKTENSLYLTYPPINEIFQQISRLSVYKWIHHDR
jgi:hypothetical protein